MLLPWKELPPELQIPELKPYYKQLYRKRGSLMIKRGFDLLVSLIMLILCSPLMLGIGIWIRLDSRGPVFFRQERVTQYGRHFRIFKFRTMYVDAEKRGTKITRDQDPRITRVGRKIRDLRLDELPQLINVLLGDMSFTGTRPEVPDYVNRYLPEWKATLLLPAGITSTASIRYKNEDEKLLEFEQQGMSVDEAYLGHILKEKMKYNLADLKGFSLIHDLLLMIKTVLAVI